LDLKPGKLTEWRLRRLMTQRDLAKAAGISEAAINRLEQGLNPPRVSTVRKLAEALNVSPDELIDLDIDREGETQRLSSSDH
jgi:transcriptional regulator with XRE-family HTH domain